MKLPKKILSTEEVYMYISADRHGLSKTQLFATVALVIKTSTVDDLVSSPSSATRPRKDVREKVAKTMKESYSILGTRRSWWCTWMGRLYTVEDFKLLHLIIA